MRASREKARFEKKKEKKKNGEGIDETTIHCVKRYRTCEESNVEVENREEDSTSDAAGCVCRIALKSSRKNAQRRTREEERNGTPPPGHAGTLDRTSVTTCTRLRDAFPARCVHAQRRRTTPWQHRADCNTSATSSSLRRGPGVVRWAARPRHASVVHSVCTLLHLVLDSNSARCVTRGLHFRKFAGICAPFATRTKNALGSRERSIDTPVWLIESNFLNFVDIELSCDTLERIKDRNRLYEMDSVTGDNLAQDGIIWDNLL